MYPIRHGNLIIIKTLKEIFLETWCDFVMLLGIKKLLITFRMFFIKQRILFKKLYTRSI